MNLRGFAPVLGLGLLLVVFCSAAWNVFRRERAEAAGVTVRIAHTQLAPGAREAFEQLARDYMAKNPGVRVEQIALPPRVYASWANTQLIGETAPDLMELTEDVTTDQIARFFTVLTREVAKPNPYNAGTPLAEMPWRDTFVDGLQSPPGYRKALLENFGIPSAVRTSRLLYNADLLARVAGPDVKPPRTLEELFALGDRLRADPKAGAMLMTASGGDASYLFDLLHRTATQRLLYRLDIFRQVTIWDDEMAIAWLRGRWSYDTPEVRAALEQIHELGRRLPAGFSQLSGSDAQFQFLQGRAVFMVASSHEARAVMRSVGFRVGACAVPEPAAGGHWGGVALGPVSESSSFTHASFGLVNQSKNAAQALDFLRFLGSRAANEKFCRTAGWPSAIMGVEPEADMAGFAPLTEGYPGGPGLAFTMGSEARRVTRTGLHRLVSEAGGVDTFVEAQREVYRTATRDDLERETRNQLLNSARLDTVLAARLALAASGRAEDAAAARERVALMDETQAAADGKYLHYRMALDTLESWEESAAYPPGLDAAGHLDEFGAAKR